MYRVNFGSWFRLILGCKINFFFMDFFFMNPDLTLYMNLCSLLLFLLFFSSFIAHKNMFPEVLKTQKVSGSFTSDA